MTFCPPINSLQPWTPAERGRCREASEVAGREVFLMGPLHLHVPTRQGKTWESGGVGPAPGPFSGDSRPRWSPRATKKGAPFSLPRER